MRVLLRTSRYAVLLVFMVALTGIEPVESYTIQANSALTDRNYSKRAASDLACIAGFLATFCSVLPQASSTHPARAAEVRS